LQFTQDMIPIHSEVTISFNGFSRVSLAGAWWLFIKDLDMSTQL
jgi:hypothetical protein